MFESFFNRIAGFPVDIVKFLRTPSFYERLLLASVTVLKLTTIKQILFRSKFFFFFEKILLFFTKYTLFAEKMFL